MKYLVWPFFSLWVYGISATLFRQEFAKLKFFEILVWLLFLLPIAVLALVAFIPYILYSYFGTFLQRFVKSG
jgi:hypothetical protein